MTDSEFIHYWPEERVKRWWDQGWDWDNLQNKQSLGLKTYTDYYSEAFSKTILFDDPRPDKTGKISEWDYWHDGKDRWLTVFAGKRWTPYHLPLYCPYGDAHLHSVKDSLFQVKDRWSDADFKAFTRGLEERIKKAGINTEYNKSNFATLAGIVIPHNTTLSFPENAVSVDFSNALIGVCFNVHNRKDRQTIIGFGSSFSYAAFFNGACFNDVIFGENTDFSKSVFGENALFKNAVFLKSTEFYFATFSKKASFADASFRDGVNFYGATFDGDVDFQCGQTENVLDRATFKNVTFKGIADFTGRKFTGKTDFRGATYRGLAKFYDAELSEQAYFTLKNLNWALPRNWWGISLALRSRSIWCCRRTPWLRNLGGQCEQTISAHDDRCNEFEKAFRALKTHMQNNNASEAAYFFGALETRSRIRMSTCTLPEKWLSSWYTLFSNYGQSVWRPFLSWLFLNALTFAGLMRLSGVSVLDTLSSCTGHQAIIFLLRNLMPGAWLRDLTYIPEANANAYQYWIDQLLGTHPYTFYGLAIGHEVITIILAFLFGLALKRRFQIK